MNSLSQRLSQLRKQSGGQLKPASELVNNPSASRSMTEKLKFSRASTHSHSTKLSDDSIANLINGKVVKPGLILVRTTIHLSKLHSKYDARFSRSLHFLSNELNSEDCLFIDTETTGLSSAAGTLVFLLGVAVVFGDNLILEQMLLSRIGAEKDMLDWFNKKCQGKTHFISYNGKSFDIPLLENRFKMNRIKANLCHHHIDLLHWVRRLHQMNMPDCRLPSAEKYCLNFSRKNDMPGSEAPSVWQDLIRYRRVDRLTSLLQHHAWDVISLAGLLHHCESSFVEKNKQIDHYSTATFFTQNDKKDIAINILLENYHDLKPKALFLLSKIYRREKKWGDAVIIWKTLSSASYLPAIECLAKYHEHIDKNLSQALNYTNDLISVEGVIKHQKRLNRLSIKLKNEIYHM